MWSSAASLVLLLGVAAERPQLSPAELAAWRRIAPSVAFLVRDGEPVGAAALIDSRGYFLAHRGTVSSARIDGRLSDGSTVVLRRAASDEPTSLVLLIADTWKKSLKPVSLSEEDEPKGRRLFAVLPSGPIRAEFFAADRLGVLGNNRRVMSLSEVRFEAPSQNVGGALVFTQSGELLGVLNATLPGQGAKQGAVASIADFVKLNAPGAERRMQPQVGPAELTVAYTIGPDALKRVVEGFRSPSHQVSHPAIGILVSDAGGKGARIERVSPGSPAHLAGLASGDVIVEMAGTPIENQIDYARVLLRQKVGLTVAVKVQRGASVRTVFVTVGR